MSKEIERKFLLEGPMPSFIDMSAPSEIIQMYLTENSDEEVRIRAESSEDYGTIFTLCHKSPSESPLMRFEGEIILSETVFDAIYRMASKLGKIPLNKFRSTCKANGHTIQIDSYESLFLKVAEVEFQSIEEAEAYTPESWFGKEVTEDPDYKNHQLWKNLNMISPAVEEYGVNRLQELLTKMNRIGG